uniref:Uncharacterized protein n=1 Tax=Panagrolaimus davidi TaxID=227884 RepID=A0A914PNK3_9BILA
MVFSKIPLKVAPLSSYREREGMIKAIINRRFSNVYDKFYDNLGVIDCWSKTEFHIAVVKVEKIKTLEAKVEAKSKEKYEIQKDHRIMAKNSF